jgi:hypothetical protein
MLGVNTTSIRAGEGAEDEGGGGGGDEGRMREAGDMCRIPVNSLISLVIECEGTYFCLLLSMLANARRAGD